MCEESSGDGTGACYQALKLKDQMDVVSTEEGKVLGRQQRPSG